MGHPADQKHRCRYPKRMSIEGGGQLPPKKLSDRCSKSTANAAVEPQKRWNTHSGMTLQGGGKQCQNQQPGCPDRRLKWHFPQDGQVTGHVAFDREKPPGVS